MQRIFNIDNIIGQAIKSDNDEFIIINKIGGGGIAEVFLAKSVNKEICLKVLNPMKEFESNLHNLEDRFVFEIEKSKKFNNENVIKSGADGLLNDTYKYYTMEYCKEGNLKDFINHNKNEYFYDIYMRFNIIIQICNGIKYIHESGIHRDIKLDNILISDYDYTSSKIQIKISDFGTFYDCVNINNNPNTLPEHRLGSLMYISPEQIKGEAVDVRTDIYSLGIVIAQILSNNTDDYRLNDFKTDNYVFLEYDVISNLNNIIDKMCKYDKSNRYNSILEVIYDLIHKVFSKVEKSISYRIIEDKKSKILIPEGINSISFPSLEDIHRSGACHANNIQVEKLAIDRNEKWIYSLGEEINSNEYFEPTESLIYNSEVLTAWSNGYITANNITTGELIWKNLFKGYSFEAAPNIYENNMILIDINGKMIIFNLISQKCEFSYNFNRECTCQVIVIDDYYVIATNDSEIIIFDSKLKTIIKKIENGLSISKLEKNKTYAVYQVKNKCIIQYKNEIEVFNDITKEAHKKWWYYTDLPGSWFEGEEIITGIDFDDLNLYIATNHGVVVSVDINTGAINWRIETAEWISLPYVTDEYLYFATSNNSVNFCNKRTGAIMKKIFLPTDSSYYSSRELINDMLYPFSNGFLVFDDEGVQFYQKERERFSNTYFLEDRAKNNRKIRIPQMIDNLIIINTSNGINCFEVSE